MEMNIKCFLPRPPRPSPTQQQLWLRYEDVVVDDVGGSQPASRVVVVVVVAAALMTITMSKGTQLLG